MIWGGGKWFVGQRMRARIATSCLVFNEQSEGFSELFAVELRRGFALNT